MLRIRFLPIFLAVLKPVKPQPTTAAVARNRLPAINAGKLRGPVVTTAKIVAAAPITPPAVAAIVVIVLLWDDDAFSR